MVSDQLIEKYFRNECNSEERQLVWAYLRDHPEVLNHFLSEEEWEQFQTSQLLDREVSERMGAGVHDTLFHRRRTVRRIVKLGIAASLVLLIGLAWMGGWFKNDHTITDSGSPATVSSFSWIERVNTSKKDSIIKLEDGTEVTMKSGSSIRYREPFAWNNRRDIITGGVVTFHVAKDKSKPFTVFSGDIATTALGTLFTVDYRAERKTITVTLTEGKVVVRPSDTLYKKWKNDYFLTPGDQLVYNKETTVANLIRGKEIDVLVKAGNSIDRYNQNRKPDWYTFNEAKLSDVFDQLSAYYDAPIYYYPVEVKDMYYTGRMEKTDSLVDILKDIALLNRLTLSRTNNTFILKRKP
ncbi:MAG: FecR domain-containing protein [Chitinophagaceae bacterium]